MKTLPYDRIEERRAALGLSGKEICRKAGLNESTLANAKRNGGALALETIEKFAVALGCTAAELRGLVEIHVGEVDASGVRLIPFAEIKPSPLNPRKTFEEEPLRELAASIAVHGLLQNLTVRPNETDGGYWIIAGERRWRAVEILVDENRFPESLAGGIPCRVIEADAAEHLALSLLENLQRRDVNPMEEANAFHQLTAIGWSTKEIAEKIGCTQRHIQQRVALTQRLAPECQVALQNGKLTFSQARAMLAAKPKEQVSLLKNIASYPTAEHIHSRATRDMIPFARAIFPRETYLGEIVEADDGKEYATDKEAFLAAQRAALARRIEELAADPANAFAIEENYFFESSFPKAEEGEPSGVVIVFDNWSGVVNEYHGRTRSPEDDAEETPEQAAERAARIAEAARRTAEFNVFAATLRTRVAGRSDIALALLLLSFDRSTWGDNCAGVITCGAGSPMVVDNWKVTLREAAAIPTREAGKIIAARLNLYEHRTPAMLIAAADVLGVPVPAFLRPAEEANPVRDDDPEACTAPDDEDDAGEFDDALEIDDDADDPINGLDPWTPAERGPLATTCPDDIA